MNRPIALTTGEPAGIGSEIAIKAWKELRSELSFFLIADRRQLASAGPAVPICEITDPAQAAGAMPCGLPVLQRDFPKIVRPGHPALENAAAVIDAIELAVRWALTGEVAAVCTNPVNKQTLRQGSGFPFPGQTELLAHLCGAGGAVMMLASPVLRAVPLTTHVALAAVAELLTSDLIVRTAKTVDAALKHDFAIPSPRISVAGLNPHAGEGGNFGREEQTILRPALEQLLQDGLSVSGPHPADSMFCAEMLNSYDAALCMYHDQALIPVKTLDFYGTVNMTLGLPIVRTSPDHGTAFDIAGKGRARPDSLISALRLAASAARNRHGPA